jgi:hypothetical protein
VQVFKARRDSSERQVLTAQYKGRRVRLVFKDLDSKEQQGQLGLMEKKVFKVMPELQGQ